MSILDRIDCALEKMAFRQMEVRAIYLNDEDRKAFDKEMTRQYRAATGSKAKVYSCSYGDHLLYRDHELRGGGKSIIYSKQGVGVMIPKRVSRRVAIAA